MKNTERFFTAWPARSSFLLIPSEQAFLQIKTHTHTHICHSYPYIPFLGGGYTPNVTYTSGERGFPLQPGGDQEVRTGWPFALGHTAQSSGFTGTSAARFQLRWFAGWRPDRGSFKNPRNWVVVWHVFYFHPENWGKISNWTNITFFRWVGSTTN